MAPRAGRSLSFAGDVLAAPEKDDVSAVDVAPPPRRSLVKVESMVSRKKSHEGAKARLDSPAKLYSTINPQYTYQKACELYGGAPRPLSGRYTFIRMAFLADTEDWRSNAMVGNANSPIARMNITNPDECTYLEEAAERKMSYTRQKSLSRAISYRQTLVKRNGELADAQYTDQYLDKETMAVTLKRQQSSRQSTAVIDDGATEILGRSLGGQPSRVLASFVSRSARPASAPGVKGKALNVQDKGMSRAVSRIMTRTRTVKLSVSGGIGYPGVDDDDESMEECPRMEDI